MVRRPLEEFTGQRPRPHERDDVVDVAEIHPRPSLSLALGDPEVLPGTAGESTDPEAEHLLRPLLDRGGYRRREVGADNDVVLKNQQMGGFS